MLPDGRRLGAHLPIANGLLQALDRASAIGADAMQIFTDNPTAWRRRSEPSTDLADYRARSQARGIRPIAIHASYLVNLPGPDALTHERSVAMLADELGGAPSFGARFVNVHIGSHRGAGVAVGIHRLVEGISAVMTALDGSDRAMLVLENSVGAGDGLGVSAGELATIAERLDAAGIDREQVGFCLDLAHAWGAGIDVGDPAAFDRFLRDLDREVGLDRLVLVHLNDNRAELGSRSDRHEHLGAGRIGEQGLAHALRHPDLAHATYILETPGMDVGYDAVNLDRAHALAYGEDLAQLPEEAFQLAGSAQGRMAST
ncbi:MAG TPA: deoxyribonuclease IV [Candidatus Limnocylindrales bacterium]|jgi:deoxyribonuclease-4|nr:deoxyribonuclease IV [Candidatus Limnocylindrales bacterium]